MSNCSLDKTLRDAVNTMLYCWASQDDHRAFHYESLLVAAESLLALSPDERLESLVRMANDGEPSDVLAALMADDE